MGSVEMREDGGPVLPSLGGLGLERGLSLRDLFALGYALMVSNSAHPDSRAIGAYQFADAMLSMREKP
jgi:hypothetical protein